MYFEASVMRLRVHLEVIAKFSASRAALTRTVAAVAAWQQQKAIGLRLVTSCPTPHALIALSDWSRDPHIPPIPLKAPITGRYLKLGKALDKEVPCIKYLTLPSFLPYLTATYHPFPRAMTSGKR